MKRTVEELNKLCAELKKECLTLIPYGINNKFILDLYSSKRKDDPYRRPSMGLIFDNFPEGKCPVFHFNKQEMIEIRNWAISCLSRKWDETNEYIISD